ncbi:MAG: hypothetical protein ABJZ55_23570 [Fuerstiella sp.]
MFLQRSLALGVALFCCRAFADDAAAIGRPTKVTQVGLVEGESWPPTDPDKLLQQMKMRDASIENRILTIEERWIERIDPKAIQAQIQFSDLKFGQSNKSYPDPNSLPDAYDQPHRRLMELIVRQSEVTLKVVGDLEKCLNPEYGSINNTGYISTNVGGSLRSYSPMTGRLHIMGSSGGMLRSRRHAFEWCTGHGFAKLMYRIKSIKATEDLIVIKGDGAVFDIDIDNTTFELEIDRNMIVRRAVISVPSGRGGFNDYRVTTDGTTKFVNAPAVAQHGVSQRVLRPAGKLQRDYTKYDITFVSLSDALTDEEYSQVVEFKPKPGVQRVGM